MMANLRSATALLVGVTLMGALPAWGVAYVTNDIYTVTAYSTSADKQQLNMYGGVIDFQNTGSGGYVRNVIRIDSPTDVVFVTTNSATPRPIDFAKDVFNPGGGQLVLSESARFGSFNSYNPIVDEGRDMVFGSGAYRQPGATGYPYLSPDVIKFVNPGDSLVLTGRLALTAWPTSCSYSIEKNSSLALYGDNMISGDVIQDGVFTVPWDYLSWVNPLCLPPTAKLVIPSGTQVTVIHTEIDTATGNLTYPAKGFNSYSNDIEVAGELLVKAQYETTFHGDITGPSAGRVNVQASSADDNIRRFSGAMSGFAGWLRLYSGENASWLNKKITKCYLDKGAPAGGIRIFAATNATTRCSFYPEVVSARAGEWHISRLQAEGVYETSTYGLRGANWYMLSKQNLTIDSLEKVGISVTGPTSTKNSSTLTIGSIQAGFELVIEKGVPVTIGSLGEGVKIRYYGTQVNTNAVNLAVGCTLGELEVPQGDTVYLNGGAVENVTGTGTLVVTGGDVRLGSVAQTVNVQVQGGTVTFGSGAILSAVLGARPAIWLDASDTEKMVGAYNTGWADSRSGKKILEAHPAVTFNGSLTATYTNGFPLVEKWFDKRPEQTLTYGWQDRCVNYESTLYTLVYPYLVPNGLNGRAYMSFGEHGMTDLPDTVGTSRASGKENEHRERRRMPLMHDMHDSKPQGDNINACALIVVFGSQQGGGRAIVGSYYGNDRWTGSNIGSANGNTSCTAKFLRGGTSNDCDIAQALFESGNGGSNAKTVWIDGRQVDSSATGLNGDWQIISVTNKADTFRSLGEGEYNKSAECSGGQNYAELIAFTNAITVAERQTVENYLALKWGLTDALSAKGSVTVAAGATVRGAVANVSGAGTWELDSPEMRLVLDGTSFAGTLASSGTVTVADAAYLPSFAPSFSGAAEVAGGNLSFTYANGTFAPALVAPDADLTFPATPTVTVTTGGTLEAGDYTLVSGKTLAGLTDCNLVHDIGGGMRVTLVRTATSLVLRVAPSGTTIIMR